MSDAKQLQLNDSTRLGEIGLNNFAPYLNEQDHGPLQRIAA